MKNKESQIYLKRLVAERLRAMPPDISFSVGEYGDYSRDELIKEVEQGSEIGEVLLDMQVEFIKDMPRLLAKKG